MLLSIKNKQIMNRFNYVVVAFISLFSSNIYATELDKYMLADFDKKLFVSEEKVNFYMFASFSLSDVHLRQMMDYAKRYNGTIVFRGVKDNSFIKTAELIHELSNQGEEAAIIIDPVLFKKFHVSQVPTYVLVKDSKCPIGVSCKPSYDKLTGSVTPKYALEKIIEKGDLYQEAETILERS